MNSLRATDTPTPLDWLNLIQRGGTEDWKRLYALCHDLAIAREVASVLPLRDPDLIAPARLWKFLLEDLHPDLKVGRAGLRAGKHVWFASQSARRQRWQRSQKRWNWR